MSQVLRCAFALSPGTRSFAMARLASFCGSGLFFPLYGAFAQVLPAPAGSLRSRRVQGRQQLAGRGLDRPGILLPPPAARDQRLRRSRGVLGTPQEHLRHDCPRSSSPGTSPSLLHPADPHHPAGRARQDRAETRLPRGGLAPLLRPPQRRRTRLRHRQRPRQQHHRPRLVPPHGPRPALFTATLFTATLLAARNQRILTAWNTRQEENQRRAARGLPPKPGAAAARHPRPLPPPRRPDTSPARTAVATTTRTAQREHVRTRPKNPGTAKGTPAAPGNQADIRQDHRPVPNVRPKRENRPH
jgi:hypothetical protein